MDKPLTATDQLDSAFRHFGELVKGTGYTVWHKLFKKKIGEIKAEQDAERDQVYKELMQLEITAKEIKDSEQSAKLLSQIYKLKGVVSALCLAFVCINIWQSSSHLVRPMRRNFRQSAKVVRRYEFEC